MGEASHSFSQKPPLQPCRYQKLVMQAHNTVFPVTKKKGKKKNQEQSAFQKLRHK